MREQTEREKAMTLPLLPTTVVGSYPQPDWLVDRKMLTSKMPPRVRAREIWRIPDEYLEQAQDDATRLAILDMERAGIATGMDLEKLVSASRWLSDIMERKLPGMVAQAPSFPAARQGD